MQKLSDVVDTVKEVCRSELSMPTCRIEGKRCCIDHRYCWLEAFQCLHLGVGVMQRIANHGLCQRFHVHHDPADLASPELVG